MKMFKMIDCSNPTSKGNSFILENGSFNFNGNTFTFITMKSSKVTKITRDGERMTVVTKNSTYLFDEIE
jgi:hypothetical protein